MRDLHGLERATDGLVVAGGTDRALARAMLVRAGLPDDDAAIARVLDAYVDHLRDILQTRRYRPLGDVPFAVAALRARGAVVGAATGNTRAGARLKLASAGLVSVFDLTYGAYGDDAEPRTEIVRIAAARCGANADARVVVVGDTERDVHAGRAIGARVVGVAAGDRARAELQAAGADAIVGECGAELVEAVLAG
jgi:phosphoglycolate phosphatase-like HAD superfamily hydrolase